MRCAQPRLERVCEMLRPIMTHPRIHEVLYREETGPRRPTDCAVDQRYYFVVRYATAMHNQWHRLPTYPTR